MVHILLKPTSENKILYSLFYMKVVPRSLEKYMHAWEALRLWSFFSLKKRDPIDTFTQP